MAVMLRLLQTNCSNLRISQDICYVRITDNKDIQTIYGHRANLINVYLFLVVYSCLFFAKIIIRNLIISSNMSAAYMTGLFTQYRPVDSPSVFIICFNAAGFNFCPTKICCL